MKMGNFVKKQKNKKSIGKRYKLARKHLGLKTLREAAELSGMTQTSISKVENNITESPSYKYTQFLIVQGINPYYLMEISDEIEGHITINLTEHEALKEDFANLKNAYQELETQNTLLERMLKMLKIEVDEKGELRKKNDR